jgi:hypothetical protein
MALGPASFGWTVVLVDAGGKLSLVSRPNQEKMFEQFTERTSTTRMLDASVKFEADPRPIPDIQLVA